MAAQTVFPVVSGIFVPSCGIPLPEDGHDLTELPRTDLPAPQLVMLANVALTSESPPGDYNAEEKQMVELKNVGCSNYSDSEDENVVRYSYDNTLTSENTYLEQDAPRQPESEPVEQDVQKETTTESEAGPEDLSKSTDSSPNERSAVRKRKHNQVIVPAASPEPAKKKKKPFYCKPCQFQAECEEEFIHHIRTHSAKKLIAVNNMADSDDETTNDSAKQQASENGASCTKGVIRCERCGYNTNRYDHYLAHLRHHKNEGDDQRVFRCTICPYSTVSQYHWKKHLRNHFPSKLFTCKQCSYFSDRKNNYIQHIRTHTGERPFQCIYCEYSSSQKTHLTRHMRTHSGEKPFKCDSCSYLAANQHEVTRHARQVHDGPKPLSCPYCQYKTADRSNFKKHVELHVNPRQFLCPVCKYAASKKCNLQYHIKSRHPSCSDISMDVSKVRLRVKKADKEDRTTPASGKQGEEVRRRNGRLETSEETDSCGPINLSLKKKSKPSSAQTAATETTQESVDVPGRDKSGRINQKTYEKKAVKKDAEKKKNEGKETNVKKVKCKTVEKSDINKKDNTSCTDKQDGKKSKELKKEMASKSVEKVKSRFVKERSVKDVNEKDTCTRDQTVTEEKKRLDLAKRLENEKLEKQKKGNEQMQNEHDGRLEKERRSQLEKDGEENEAENAKDRKKSPPKKLAKKHAKVAKGNTGENQMHNQETHDSRKIKVVKHKAERIVSKRKISSGQNTSPEKIKRRKVVDTEKPSTSTSMIQCTATTLGEVKLSKGKGKQSRKTTNMVELSLMESEMPTRKECVLAAERPKSSQVELSLLTELEQGPEQPTLPQQEKPSLEQRLEKPNLEQQPQKPTLNQQLEKPSLGRQPAKPPALVQQPVKPPALVQQPEKLPTLVQQPEKPTLVQQPEKPTLVQQPEKPALVQQLQKPTLDQQPEKPSLKQQQLKKPTLQQQLEKPTLKQQQLQKPTLQQQLEKPTLKQQQLQKPTLKQQELKPASQQQLEKPTVVQQLETHVVPKVHKKKKQQQPEKLAANQDIAKTTLQTCSTENTATDHCTVESMPVATEEVPKTRERVQPLPETVSAKEIQPKALKKAATSAEKKKTARESPEVDKSNEEIPSPTESDPGFSQESVVKSPTLDLPGPKRSKPTDAEDDEGIHSHDGGSDISDCASEGSYDSGLNGLANATEKLPETPTEEIPSPTQLVSHTCVFCDRTFPLEMDYRRHLNRHLVNVYYLETAAQGEK
ncbi:RE1-silencing transcription factor isoform X2 [Hoplias malabaricus]|uniref:RE1-silencing transcription factor isoform X2 n=1 Tax=Hoplias malabaricus TaxID=27720 RepID=UPI003462FE63